MFYNYLLSRWCSFRKCASTGEKATIGKCAYTDEKFVYTDVESAVRKSVF